MSNKITYVHDSKGRISEIDGAVSGIKTIFDYNGANSDATKDNFLSDYKIYKDATNYLQPLITTYDFWGHPTSLKAPDGNFTCDTYDSDRGFLAKRRRAMAGQTDCSGTPNSADLITSWQRDSWLRLTKVTLPEISPNAATINYTYDSIGRLSQMKRSDSDCVASCVGDYQTFNYTQPGTSTGCPGIEQVCEVDTFDSTGAQTAKQPYSYFAGRQLQDIVNPVSTSQFTGLVYDAAGKLTEVDGASSLSKTVYHFDNTTAPGRDNRVTSEERFKTGSASDTWSLLYAWMGGQSQLTDPDSKVTGSTHDDLSRLVKITSPDLAGPTVRVYDAANRLTTLVEDQGGGANQVTSTFTYDNMNRQLTADYGARCPTGTTHETIIRTYDSVTCPTGMTTHPCTNINGRLAYVQTTLLCSSSYTDGSLDQQTYFAYDDAGRVIEEYTTDDSGRVADTQYAYWASGAIQQVTTPSSAVIGWDYGSSNASDMDRVTKIWRTSSATPIIDSVAYFPAGPWKTYNWETSIAGVPLKNSVDRNLAYRITTVHGALQGSTENAKVAITEDAMGRVTSRVYTPHDPTLAGLFDSYFTYDEQSRVVCEATSSGTCPTSGSTLKNNHDQTDPFRPAGDWKEILRPIAGSTGGTINNFNTTGTNYGTSHQVTDVNQSNGTPTFGHTAFAYDARGLRSYDDNTTTLTNDRRDYTYDARRNLVNVRGQYFTGGAWHYYDVASAYDHKNRRVFKSFYDETTLKTAQSFFYYDASDRLTEIKYTPDISSSGTYSTFQLFWLGSKLVLFYETDTPSGTVSKRYVASDETDRPIQLWNWPSSGDASRVWAINPSGWGFDNNIIGATVFQPILFSGQYVDVDTSAYENDGATVHRPGISASGSRSYDPFVGAYLQANPGFERSWSSYVFAWSNPLTARADSLKSTAVDAADPPQSAASDDWTLVPLANGGSSTFSMVPGSPVPACQNNENFTFYFGPMVVEAGENCRFPFGQATGTGTGTRAIARFSSSDTSLSSGLSNVGINPNGSGDSIWCSPRWIVDDVLVECETAFVGVTCMPQAACSIQTSCKIDSTPVFCGTTTPVPAITAPPPGSTIIGSCSCVQQTIIVNGIPLPTVNCSSCNGVAGVASPQELFPSGPA